MARRLPKRRELSTPIYNEASSAAEVVGYDDLVGAGSWDAAKAKGLLRVEGKEYVVAEGDILNIRFAV